MKIEKFLHINSCKTNLNISTKENILKEISSTAHKHPYLSNLSEDEIYELFLKREEQGSTALGNGVAIPHARSEKIKDFVIFIFTTTKGISFDAPDNEDVRLFFIVLGPTKKSKQYLKILALISRANATEYFHANLLNSSSGTDLVNLFNAAISKTKKKAKNLKKNSKIQLFILVLYNLDMLSDVLECYLLEGIEGANIMDSSDMGEFISNIPLFIDFLGFMNEENHLAKTVMALVPENKVSTLINGIENITGDLDKTTNGMIMTLDIGYFKGAFKMM